MPTGERIRNRVERTSSGGYKHIIRDGSGQPMRIRPFGKTEETAMLDRNDARKDAEARARAHWLTMRAPTGVIYTNVEPEDLQQKLDLGWDVVGHEQVPA